MMKCKVHTVLNEGQQKQAAIKAIKDRWLVDAVEGSANKFPMPSEEAIDAERPNHPLITFEYDGHIIEFTTQGEGDAGVFYPYAVVRRPCGFLTTVDIEQVQIEVDSNE